MPLLRLVGTLLTQIPPDLLIQAFRLTVGLGMVSGRQAYGHAQPTIPQIQASCLQLNGNCSGVLWSEVYRLDRAEATQDISIPPGTRQKHAPTDLTGFVTLIPQNPTQPSFHTALSHPNAEKKCVPHNIY
ncbi:hypothetical protein DPEC_G00145990 [Dallia pectoralis]|uniref:Uncharacterized protein n=1 Tax=Dallia pectoralis TaxID=75939 RepID=A0ACC2GP97_DALPE|nr:hypothetical protein DPEC_G00145990 [Dallia pectoralis]